MGLKTLIIGYLNKKESPFAIPVEIQEAYMKKLQTPNNLIKRSKNQYRCQMKALGIVLCSAFNIISAVLMPLHMIAIALRSKLKKQNVLLKSVDAIYLKDLPLSYIPKSVMDTFATVIQINPNGERFFGKRELIFLKELITQFCSPYLIYKTMLIATRYAYVLRVYSPKCIIVSNEFSFTSSCLTQYCFENDVLHYNVMHGEKIYNFRDSFFQYTKCFVWSKEYVNLFCKLYASAEQFEIELPPCMMIDIYGSECAYDGTYYLQNESSSQLVLLKAKLDILKEKGWKIAIRPHPRYSNIEEIDNVFSEYYIEECSSVSIETSINNTKMVISRYSTVLLQAALNGKSIVIDDITDAKQYNELRKRECGCFVFRHALLSDLCVNKSEH